jgi:hypothetical protein
MVIEAMARISVAPYSRAMHGDGRGCKNDGVLKDRRLELIAASFTPWGDPMFACMARAS